VAGAAPFALERVVDVDAQRLPCRKEAEGDADHYRRRQCGEQHRRVDGDAVHARDVARQERDERTKRRPCQRHTERPTNERQQERLDEELLSQSCEAGAERGAQRLRVREAPRARKRLATLTQATRAQCDGAEQR
jgi:hypothetical protein